MSDGIQPECAETVEKASEICREQRDVMRRVAETTEPHTATQDRFVVLCEAIAAYNADLVNLYAEMAAVIEAMREEGC